MNKLPVYNSDPFGLFYLEWPGKNFKDVDVVFYTDKQISKPDKIGKIKIARLYEPEEINLPAYNYLRKNHHEFDYIFTWDKRWLSFTPKAHFLTYGNSSIGSEGYMIHPKTKLLSIIASAKNALPGHQMRHEVIRTFKNMDVYGRGYNPVPSVFPVFQDYMFSIVIENTNEDCNMSEKIITPFLCGTVPIFYGCPSIHEHFDTRGMFTFSTIEELRPIIESLTPEKYSDMLEYVQINFELAKKHDNANDALYNKLIQLNIIEEI